MVKAQNKLKKISLPTISRFNGEESAVYIFEEIMHRQHWCVADREVLRAKIESIVSEEIKRQKTHREKVIEVKKINASIAKLGK